jgi:PAS domain S-box-containing protein
VLDFCFQTTALFLISLRGGISDWISVVVANTLVIAGAVLGFAGLGRFVGKKISQVHNYALLGAFACVHAWFTFVNASLPVRNFNFSLVLLIVCFQCLWLLLRGVEEGMRRLTFGVGVVFGGYCVVNILRIAEFFLGSHIEQDYLHSGPFQTFILLSYQVLLILLAYNLVLMCNKRLLLEVKTQKEKFSKAFHSSPCALTLTRLSDGKIVEVNEGFTNISGYRPWEVVGRTTLALHFWDSEEDRAAIVQELGRRGQVKGRELRFRKKSGDPITAIFSAEVIRINHQEFILSNISDITAKKVAEVERERMIRKLQEALARVKQLSGLLPICASCKKIRDDKGYWTRIENYIRAHSEAEFSHGLCPQCAEKLYPQFMGDVSIKEEKRYA